MSDEPFTLSPPKSRGKVWRAEDRPRMRQGKLLSGTDCLPGQSELFAADGPREREPLMDGARRVIEIPFGE